MNPVFRRDLDGTVHLCDPRVPGTGEPLVTCRGAQPSDKERHAAGVLLAMRRRQVGLFGGAA